jgi:cell pole-organizing protein PopZ
MSKFGDAFAAARKAGKKEFTFNGKKYHTRTKEDETKRAKATAPVETSGKMKVAKTASAGKAKVDSVSAPPQKSRAGAAYSRMASSPSGVPGKKKAEMPKDKPADKAAPSPRKYGRSRNTVVLNSPKAGTVSRAPAAPRRTRGRIPR